MSGVRGRSGPPGNLNAARHHWRSFFDRLALREQDLWVRTEARKYAADLLSDKPEASETERHAIELAAEAKAARLLIWSAIAGVGFTHQSDEGLALVPAAEALPRFIGVELGALKLLGLQRRAKATISLQDYLVSKAQQGVAIPEDQLRQPEASRSDTEVENLAHEPAQDAGADSLTVDPDAPVHVEEG